MHDLYSNYGMGFGGPAMMWQFGPAIILLSLWSIFWKGLALWHAGRKGQPGWFVILLLVNTAGILELIYLFGVLKIKSAELFSKK